MDEILDFKFSNDSKRALEIAQTIAADNSQKQFSSAHLMRALLHKDFEIFSTLLNLEKDVYYVEEWADVRIESVQRHGQLSSKPTAGDDVLVVIGEADNIRIKLGHDEIEPLSLFISAITPGVSFSYEQLKTFPVMPNELIDACIADNEFSQTLQGQESKGGKTAKKDSTNLLKFCIDLNGKAQHGELEPVVARDNEIRQMLEILGRRFKPNVLVIGDTGVGKTSLVHGFVQKIISEEFSARNE
ncbi:MAG: ATP-dependent Clp protease ATP-binding subunit, partial [Bacteroidota bacterium]|nr:ATP-dependent Clp protease ATP-binding subunit [Bacteroidota bacterium]